MRKKGHLTGYLMGLGFISKMNEIAFLVTLQKAIDNNEWKTEGYESVKDFCRQVSGASYETVHRRLETIKHIGPEVTSILSSLGRGIKDARMIEHALIEDPRTGKKALRINEQQSIPFDEDRKDDIQTAIDLMREQIESARKDSRHAQSKLDSIEREHKKEVKAMNEEITGLKAMLPSGEDDGEWADRFVEDIKQRASKFDFALRSLAFNKKTITDPAIQARIMGAFEEMRTGFEHFARDFEAHITAEVD